MGTKAQNDEWRNSVDRWEEDAMIAGIRAARVFADQAKAWTPYLQPAYMRGWCDRICGIMPPARQTKAYAIGYIAATDYFSENPPPQPVAAKPVMRTRFG